MSTRLEAERAVIGMLLVNASECIDVLVAKLKPDNFSLRSLGLVFSEILEMHQKNETVDLVTVTQSLKKKKLLEHANLDYELSKLATGFYVISHAENYADIVLEESRRQKLSQIAGEVQTQSMESVESSLEIIDRTIGKLIGLSENKMENQLDSACKTTMERIQAIKRGEKVTGISTGLLTIDEIEGGFHASKYYILAGRPSMGKSALADQITVSLVTRGVPVLYVGLEASDGRILEKMACKLAQVNYIKFIKNHATTSELSEIERAVGLLRKSPLILRRPTSITAIELRSMIRTEKKKNGIEVFVLDYIQNVSYPDNVEERIGLTRTSKQIMNACVESKVAGLVLAQINREGADDRPTMKNLKGSGSLEQDADSIYILWSKENPTTWDDIAAPFPAILTAEKNRDGYRGDKELLFNRPIMKFLDKAREPSKPKTWYNNE